MTEDSIRRGTRGPAGSTRFELALDLRWPFNHAAADRIWEPVAPDLWESTHNSWFVLQTWNG